MVGGGNRKDELVISNSNVFAALGSLKKKKKSSDKDSKTKTTSASTSTTTSSSSAKKQEQKEPEANVFWVPSPLTSKSWADVDDEDDDDYYATTAPPQSVWCASAGEAEHQTQPKESSTPVEGSESEEGFDEVDDDNEEEQEHEHEHEVQAEKEPDIKKPVEVVANKETERQLSKKELKKKELAELEEMLAQFGYNKGDDQDAGPGTQPDKKSENGNDVVNKKDSGAAGESKSAKKKKKKDKSSKDSKERQDEPNGSEVVNGTDDNAEIHDVNNGTEVDVKQKIKKVASLKKKKSSKEMDAAARFAASEAAARNAKLAAAKKKEKSHYNQQPQR